MKTSTLHNSANVRTTLRRALNFCPPRLAFALLVFAAAHVLFAPGRAAAAVISVPPVVFSVEPEENGALVYMPVVAPTANESARNLFGLRVDMVNNATNSVRLTSIRIVFTFANASTLVKQFSRDLTIAAGDSVAEYLTPDESIQLPALAPVSAQIQLYFDGYGLPKSLQRSLAAYESPATGGKYLFPANESDLGAETYFSHIDPHTGGSQFFGYDLHVRRWDGGSFSSIEAGGDPNKNEDSVGWGTPIYAMADGIVLKASTGFEENPSPGSRVIQRMDDHTGEAIADVKVTKMSASRAASAVRLPSGNLKLAVWDTQDVGREIIPRGSTNAEVVGEIALEALTGTRIVTAVQAGNNLRVIAWDVSADGESFERVAERDAAAVKEISLMKISSSRFATAVRTEEDVLRLIVWEVSGGSINILSDAFAGTASSVSLVALSGTRLATSLRTSQGTLKLIVWELLDNGATIDRRGENSADAIIKAVSVKTSGTNVVTAMQTARGDLKVLRWGVSDDGEVVTKGPQSSAGQIQGLTMAATFDDAVLTAVITEQGILRNILWRPPKEGEDQTQFVRWGEEDAGTVSRMSYDCLDGGLFFSAVRTAGGDFKAITWWAGSGGGNCLYILHGNCRVLYAHFVTGTTDPAVFYPGARVAAGQYLARMGNSGSSEGPHTHIHAERVAPFLTVEEMIELDAEDNLPLLGYRPIPFHCGRAIRLSSLHTGGEGNPLNAFSTLQGDGLYFNQYAVRPTWLKEMYVNGSTTCISPSGRKLCVNAGLFNVAGPFPLVNQALNAGCWGHQLFIRGGSYNESVTFNRSMTVRAYEGTATIGQ